MRDDDVDAALAGVAGDVAGRADTGGPSDVAVGLVGAAGDVAGRADTGVPSDVAVGLVGGGAGVRDDDVDAVDDAVDDGALGAGVRADDVDAADDVDDGAGVRDDDVDADDNAVAGVPDAGVPDDGVPAGVFAAAGAGVPDDGVPDGAAAAGVAGRAEVDAGDVAGRVVVFVVGREAAGVPAGGVLRDGIVTVACVPAGGVAVRRAAASASCVVIPPLELVLPIAPSTDEIGDDGGSSTGTGVSGRVAPNAVGDRGFTPPVPARGIGCCGAAVFEPAAGVGGGFAPVGRCTVGASSAADGGGGGGFAPATPFVSIAAVEARLTVLTVPVVVAVADAFDFGTGFVSGAGADSLTSFASCSPSCTGVCCSSCHSASSIASSSKTGVPLGVFVGLVIA